MKIEKILCIAICLCALLRNATATTWYVATNGNDSAAGTSWATAKSTIQAAIDVAVSNDSILVSNGVYATGGRVVYGAMKNRIAITNAVTVCSVNGPAVTVIRGVGPRGDSAVRCAYVGSNAVLSGFALIQGATRLIGDDQRERSGGGAWCETSGTLNNCVLSGCSASLHGGGSYYGALNHCTLTGNSASSGGGSCDGALNHCVLSSNSASLYGGGSYYGALNHCTLTGNSASSGGGSCYGKLNNCALSGCSASYRGGGAYGSALNHCTLTGNSASEGGGVYNVILNHCIVYYNDAVDGPNFLSSSFNYSCTTPNPGDMLNITNEPKLASASHLAAGSPCIGAGRDYATETDIDGEAWQIPPSLGCDEVVVGSITGALSVSAWASHANVTAGFPIRFRAEIGGRTTGSAWDFGDGTVLSNQPYAAHTFSSNGVYAVLLWAFNESYPLGVAATVTVVVSAQTIHYVNIHNPTPAAPYVSWATAATNIQDAVDAVTQAGALVLVSNGVYAAGGRALYKAMTNRLAIAKPVTVRSVNGPAATVIRGAGPVGDGAVRCAYVGTNAVLSGFTLANGATLFNGDHREESGGGAWCEISGALSNCVLSGCSASYGGGGSYGGALNHCTLWGCSASYGGGSYGGVLNHCALSSCSASSEGGGVYDGALSNCALWGCSASYGGGSYGGALNHCTLSGCSASYGGGGSYLGTLNNCIVYYNDASDGSNFQNCTFNHSCTTPNPGGTGNITNEPKLASASHLAAGSPCIGAGHSDYATGTDIDGEAWQIPPSMGCDELVVGSITGALSVSAWASHTNVTVGFSIRFWGETGGRTAGSAWDFGDGAILSNAPYAAHTFSSNGVYAVLLRAFNESDPLGVAATATVVVSDRVIHYVNVGNPTPIAPYTSWATAATNIQDAVDAATQVGALVLVSNGIYATGGRTVYSALTNRVAITKPVTVRSVNGPAATVIQGAGPVGAGAVRCAYVGTNAVLSGFTLTNGATLSYGVSSEEGNGGGVWCEAAGTLNHCVLSGCSAAYGGGGTFGGALYDCLLSDCSATTGGGASDGVLNNCTISGCSASGGGGTFGGTLNNCIVYYNNAVNGSNSYYSTFNYSCTTPDPGGTGNITNEPRFVNAAAGNYCLSANSPCRDKGDNAYAQETIDLDGNPRIVNGTVDMGAYEYQVLVGYWAWASAITNGLTNFNQCATGDGYPNLLKYATGSSPTNSDNLARLNCGLSNEWFLLWFNRNTNAADMTLMVEGAYALTNNAAWNGVATNVRGSWGNAANVAETGATNPAKVTVREPVAAATNRFMRLRVTWP